MSADEMSISVLGDKLKCQKKGCNEFARIRQLKLASDKVMVALECPTHDKKTYEVTFTHPQFQKLIETGLIDEKDVKTYQFKFMVLFQQYIRFDEGYDRVFVLDDRELIQKAAQKLFLCPKCTGILNLRIREIKMPKNPKKAKKNPPGIVIDQSCPECGKTEVIAIKLEDFNKVSHTGLLDPELTREFRELLEMEGWTAGDGYGVPTSILAPHAAEALGITGERDRRCLMCGEIVAKGVDRCPKCGNDLDVE